MSVKRMMLFAGMAAVAFAAPAAAQATVTLTDPPGFALAAGAKVTATSTNLQMHTPIGTLDCAKVTLHTEVTNNGPTHVTLKPVAAEPEATTETCVLTTPEKTFPVTIDDWTVGTVTINTKGNGSTAATFVSTIYNEAYPGVHNPANVISRCHFSGSVAFQGTNGTDILNVPGSNLTATPYEGGPCTATEGEITGSFTLETTNGTQVIIDHS